MTSGLPSHHGPTEQMIQAAVCNHLLWRQAPGLVWFHCPNGGYRTATEARIMKGLGVKAGVADLILVHDGRFYALELKTKTGKATESQLKFITHWQLAGGIGYIAHGLDDAVQWLESNGLLRRSKGGDHARSTTADELATSGP